MIELLDGFYIDQKPNNFVLKQKYVGTRKGKECECEKIISFHPTFKDAAEAFLELFRARNTDDRLITLTEYLKDVEKANTVAVEAIEVASMNRFYMYAPKASPKPKEETLLSIAELIPFGKENAIRRRDLLKKCVDIGLVDEKAKDPDRNMRKLISRARLDFAILNDQDSQGYYRPTKEDYAELRKHIAQEKKRAVSVFRTIRQEEALLEDIMAERL